MKLYDAIAATHAAVGIDAEPADVFAEKTVKQLAQDPFWAENAIVVLRNCLVMLLLELAEYRRAPEVLENV